MPNRLAATICACEAASDRAPSTGSTGAVPNGRVSWPSPCWMTVLHCGSSLIMSDWCGATPSPVASAPTHTPTSWAIFSSSDIFGRSASARSAGVSRGSRHGAVSLSPGN